MTPVSMLQERMQKLGEDLPKYSFSSNMLSVGEAPLFKYIVSARGITATACGKSKQEAKHKAAEALLRVFKEPDNPINISPPIAANTGSNYISTLQIYCQRTLKHLPEYKLVRDSESSPTKFRVTCSLKGLTSEGTAFNKKDAKQFAAREMLSKLGCPSLFEQEPGGELKNVGSSALSVLNASGVDKVLQVNTAPFESGKLFTIPKKKSFGDNKPSSNLCYLCKNAFNESVLLPSSEILAPDVHRKLSQKEMPVSEAVFIMKDCEDSYFEDLDDIDDFFDVIMNQLDCIYFIHFTQRKLKNYVECCIKIKDLRDASFTGIACSPKAALKKAVVNTLRALHGMLKKHKYHGYYSRS